MKVAVMAVALVKRAFHKHPFLFNCVVHGTLYTGTDFSQQTFRSKIMKSEIEHPKSFDIGSLSRYAVVGFAIYPIMLHNWYKWLDKHYVGTAAKTVVKKLLLDQFIFTPPLIAAFYISMSLMERKGNIFEECAHKLAPTFKTSCWFWLPAQTVNFLLVPPAARVVYVGFCAFIWVNILCWYKRQHY